MTQLYECSDGSVTYWEVYNGGKIVQTLESKNEFELYIDILKASHVDFALHTLEAYTDYHLRLVN
jgi:hypothetical protein